MLLIFFQKIQALCVVYRPRPTVYHTERVAHCWGFEHPPTYTFPDTLPKLGKKLWRWDRFSTRTNFFLVLFFLFVFLFPPLHLRPSTPHPANLYFRKYQAKKGQHFVHFVNLEHIRNLWACPKKFSPIKNTDPPN